MEQYHWGLREQCWGLIISKNCGTFRRVKKRTLITTPLTTLTIPPLLLPCLLSLKGGLQDLRKTVWASYILKIHYSEVQMPFFRHPPTKPLLQNTGMCNAFVPKRRTTTICTALASDLALTHAYLIQSPPTPPALQHPQFIPDGMMAIWLTLHFLVIYVSAKQFPAELYIL